MKGLLNWLEDRTGWIAACQSWLSWTVPGGPRWRYVWGTTLVFVFVVQLITGLFLWLAYSPSTITAWESVYYINQQMTFGWLIRGIHHFAAQAMMILLALHLVQVVIAGAYRAPRELTYWTGLALIPLVMVFGQTGYLLPWDQRGMEATKVATGIAGSSPVIGAALQRIAQGGPTLGHATLTRFFALHAGLLPLLFISLLLVHRGLVRRQRLAGPTDRPAVPYWPQQAGYDLTACLAVLAAVIGVTYLFGGAELGGPAGLSDSFQAARPEWYFLFLFRLLRFEFVKDFGGLAFGGIYVPTAVMTVFALMPFIARIKGGYTFNIAYTAVVGVCIVGLTALALSEDAKDTDYLAATAQATRDAHRAVELADGMGIPAEGAARLMRNDPLTQGPRLFALNCAACHHYYGHDGTGRVVTSIDPNTHAKTPAVATAADLGKFGSREWLKSVLVDFHGVFAPLKNAKVGEENLGDKFLGGDMAGWSTENKAVLEDPANAESLNALVEFLAGQSGRHHGEPTNAALYDAGAKIFSEGALASGSLSSNCTDCHTLQPVGSMEVLGNAAGPTLTGYAGKAWLRQFIENPAHTDCYGEKNAMPAFAGRMSAKELDLLVNWMVGDYYRSPAK